MPVSDAMAAGTQCSGDELPTALRQAARQVLHTVLAPELEKGYRGRVTRLLRLIEGEQVSSEWLAV